MLHGFFQACIVEVCNGLTSQLGNAVLPTRNNTIIPMVGKTACPPLYVGMTLLKPLYNHESLCVKYPQYSLINIIIVATIIAMNITCDSNKRSKTLDERGVDFMDAVHVFAGKHLTAVDERKEYGEIRQITIGFLHGRMMVVGWVRRENDRHVFTMRKANEREIKKYRERLEQS